MVSYKDNVGCNNTLATLLKRHGAILCSVVKVLSMPILILISEAPNNISNSGVRIPGAVHEHLHPQFVSVIGRKISIWTIFRVKLQSCSCIMKLMKAWRCCRVSNIWRGSERWRHWAILATFTLLQLLTGRYLCALYLRAELVNYIAYAQ